MEVIIVVVLAALIGFGSAKILKKDDNIIEETMEEIIKLKTGIDIDLTPNSPESKNDVETKDMLNESFKKAALAKK